MATSGALHVSSRLLRTEVVRVLRREGIPASQAAPLLDRVGLLDITREYTASPKTSGLTSRRSTPYTWRPQ